MADSRLRIILTLKDEATRHLKQASKGIDRIAQGTISAGKEIQKLGKDFLYATAAIAGLGYAAKKAFDFARQGAEIHLAEDRFRRLSDQMGISNSFLDDMQTKTRGVRSEFDLMSSATDIMRLKLVDNEDQLRRLVVVAGELGFDMNEMVLTLTNQTTRRFDQLGVAVGGFQEKVDALMADGMSKMDAFTEAFIQQAEEQSRTVGSIADSQIGAYMRVEAEAANTWTRLKKNAGDALEPIVARTADALEIYNRFNDAVEVLGIRYERLGDTWVFVTSAGVELGKSQEEVIAAFEQIKERWKEIDATVRDSWMVQNYAPEVSNMVDETEKLALVQGNLKAAFSDLQLVISSNVSKQFSDFKGDLSDLQGQLAALDKERLAAITGLGIKEADSVAALQKKISGLSDDLAIAKLRLSEMGDEVDASSRLAQENRISDIAADLADARKELKGLAGSSAEDLAALEAEYNEKTAGITGKIDEVTKAWERQTAEIVFNMATQRFGLDGFTAEELDVLRNLAGPKGLGLIDEAAVALLEQLDLLDQAMAAPGDQAPLVTEALTNMASSMANPLQTIKQVAVGIRDIGQATLEVFHMPELQALIASGDVPAAALLPYGTSPVAPSGNTNNMNLTINSQADSEDLQGQFQMMKALSAGAN